MPAQSTGYQRRPVYRKKPSRRVAAPVYHAPAPRYRPPAPTRTQIRSSRAQARQYASQGRQLKREASRQRRAVQRRKRQSGRAVERYLASQGQQLRKEATRQRVAHRTADLLSRERYYSSYARAMGVKRTPEELIRVSKAAGIPALGLVERTPRIPTGPGPASQTAPLRWGLRQLMRTGHAAGGAAYAIGHGKNVPSETLKGLKLKTHHTVSGETLAHWKPKGTLGKIARGASGLAIDVVSDPATWVTGGTAGVGKTAALKASERVGQAAARTELRKLAPKIAAGELTRSEAVQSAKNTGERIARTHFKREAAKHAGEQRGVTLRVNVPGGKTTRRAYRAGRRRVTLDRALRAERRGKPAPAVRRRTRAAKRPTVAPVIRTTAALAKSQRRGLAQLDELTGGRVAKLRKAGRNIGASAHAGVRHASVTGQENEAIKALVREATAHGEKLRREGTAQANALTKRLKGDDAERVYDAIEGGKIGRLERLHETSLDLKDLPKAAREQVIGAARAGIPSAVRDPEWRKLAQRLAHWDRSDRERVIEAATGGRTMEHLRDTAHEIRSANRGVRRVEERASTLATRVGTRSRARGEVRLSSATRPARKVEVRAAQSNYQRARQRVTSLRDQVARARKMKTPPEQLDKLLERYHKAGEDAVKAREKMIATERQPLEAAEASTQIRRARSERLRGQAKEYVARIKRDEIDYANKSRIEKIAEPPPRQFPSQFGAQTVRPDPSKEREFRAPLSALREGTPQEQRVAAATSSDIRGVQARRAQKGAAGVERADLNRKLADTFGEKLPRNITHETLNDLEQRGLSVYRLHRGHLLPTDDIAEVKRAAMTSSERAAKDIKTYRARKYAEAEQLPVPAAPATKGDRYVVLPKAVVERAYSHGERLGSAPILEAADALQNKWKGIALGVPSYLVRNLGGDTFNAWTDEDLLRLARNLGRGQRALQAGGKRARALERRDTTARRKALHELSELRTHETWLKRQLSPGLRDIQLTEAQAREVAGPSADRIFNELRAGYKQTLRRQHPDWSPTQINARLKEAKGELQSEVERRLASGKVSSLALAEHAERMGVTGQGRTVELAQEGRNPFKGRGTSPWRRTVRRVEDSARIATFIGGLQRGMTSREAATRASKIHFDYNDLTPFEKDIARRVMPFYTFPSRNIPFQARQLVRRPGKYATVEKAREQVAGQQGVDIRKWERSLGSQFERKQLPIPIRAGGKVYPVSLASPFTDLNDVISFAGGAAALANAPKGSSRADQILQLADVPMQRFLEQLTPLKVPFEVKENYSSFFREPIEPQGPGANKLTEAPGWAVQLAKHGGPLADEWIKGTGLTHQGDTWMWRKKADYVMRSSKPGLIGALSEVASLMPGAGQEKSGRGRTKAARLIGIAGPRVGPAADPKAARQDRARDRFNALESQASDYRAIYKARHGGKLWKTPDEAPADYQALLARRRRQEALSRGEKPERKKKGSGRSPSLPTSAGVATGAPSLPGIGPG